MLLLESDVLINERISLNYFFAEVAIMFILFKVIECVEDKYKQDLLQRIAGPLIDTFKVGEGGGGRQGLKLFFE